MNQSVIIYDSTLRDGAQAQGVSFTVEDKLKIVERLDTLGIGYIEAGNPGSNPKDLVFFERASKLKLKQAKIIAFLVSGPSKAAIVKKIFSSISSGIYTSGFLHCRHWYIRNLLQSPAYFVSAGSRLLKDFYRVPPNY